MIPAVVAMGAGVVLSTLLIGVMQLAALPRVFVSLRALLALVLIGSASVAALCLREEPPALIAATAFVGLLVMLLLHVLGARWARRQAPRWRGADWIQRVARLGDPITAPFVWIARRWMPDVTEVKPSVEEENRELLSSIASFGETVIREVMVPRPDMVAIDAQTDINEVRQRIIDAGLSRIPVYRDTMDEILGVLHVKDLFTAETSAAVPDIRALLRPAIYVPEIMQISELLKEFQRRKTHLAIVVDEYGGTAGLVTLEDVLEEIVGEIHDEYDVDEKQFRRLGDGKLLADGRVNVVDLEEVLGVTFPEDREYETLAGFLNCEAGELLRPGGLLDWEGIRFVVKEANARQVQRVEIERV
jgi:CBS domain containing-hemolysin-like protein